MVTNMIAGVVIVAIIVVVVIWFQKPRKAPLDWDTQMKSLIIQQDFIQQDQDVIDLTYRLNFILGHKSGEWKIENLYRRLGNNFVLYVFDYLLIDKQSKGINQDWDWMVCLVSHQLDLPRITIEAIPKIEGWFGSLLKSMFTPSPPPTLQKYSSINPDFDNRYLMYADNAQKLFTIVNEEVVSCLLAAEDINLDVMADTMLIQSLDIIVDKHRKRFHPEHVVKLFSLAEQLFQKMALVKES